MERGAVNRLEVVVELPDTADIQVPEDIQRFVDTLESVAMLPVGRTIEQHRLADIVVGTVHSPVGGSQHSRDIVVELVECSRVSVRLVEARILAEEDI